MRVTGGVARGRRLRSPPGGVRPTVDRVREAVFDVLEARGVGKGKVLDLYAGSGAFGIEALSRGADHCDFVERNARVAGVIRENLALTKLDERGKVYVLKAEQAVERLGGPYSMVFADPPYEDEEALTIVARIASSPLVDSSTTLVLEQSSRSAVLECLGALPLCWNRRYGDTQVSVYEEEEA